MVQFDNQYRQIKIKIVYYGPALGGKTTCLQYIHRVADPQRRTKLYSLNTANDRTLFFDLLGLDLGRIRGYRLTLQLYTVPGQVQYNATRRAVLAGADGVVFVADSQTKQRLSNSESLQNLSENLEANSLEEHSMPLVLQYNKRDLNPVQPIDEMDSELNPRGLPAFPSVAISGQGLMEAFAAITEITLAAVADKLGVGDQGDAVARLQAQAKAAIAPLVTWQSEPGDAATTPEDRITLANPVVREPRPLKQEELVAEAVNANLAMTDLNTQLDALRNRLQAKVRALELIATFSREVGALREPDEVLETLVEVGRQALAADAAAIVLAGSRPLEATIAVGLENDPLLDGVDETGESLALGILDLRRALLLSDHGEDVPGLSPLAMERIQAAGMGSALSVPLEIREKLAGLLNLYRAPSARPFEDDDLQVAEILAANAAMGHANAESWRQLRELNRGLENQVEARTEEVRQSLADVERLAGELRQRNAELEEAYRELAGLDQVKAELITRISQELKGPVSSLVTAARILERYRDAPPEKGERFLKVLLEEAEKLSEMIQGVVQASVLAASGKVEKKSLNVEELLKKAVTPLRELAQAREVRISFRVASGINAIQGDEDSLATALSAVIKNALEFSKAGDEVLVEVRSDPEAKDHAILRVKDVGAGIPQNEIPDVLEPFRQGSNLLTGKTKGLGLGLAIAQRVAKRHGGAIRISSGVGEGTEVTISLPVGSD